MSEKQETIADIVTERRREADKLEASHFKPYSFIRERIAELRQEADRIEAAHKWEVGNAAKMREALESVDDAFSEGSLYASGDCPTPHDVSVFENVRDKVKAALAEPPRNCDVGTAEEQTVRYNKFCYKNKTTERSCGDCPACSAYAIIKKDCRLVWAQMPYEPKRGDI